MAEYHKIISGAINSVLGDTDVQEVNGAFAEVVDRVTKGLTADTAGAMTSTSAQTFSGVVTLSDSLAVTGAFNPTGAVKVRPTSAVSTAQTITAADSGKTYVCSNDTAGAVHTLPATAAGLVYTFVVESISNTARITIKPAAADKIVANNQATTVPADKDGLYIDGSDTSNQAGRDAMTLVGDGTNGWYAIAQAGEWKVNTNP